jgi:superfamily II DNA or RNA helicase
MNSRFIDRMILHWTNTLRLPCTSALIESWAIFEEAVEAAAKQRRWQVLPAPTGAGKTEALIVLLATPTINEHPGALVITKFKCEADKIARAINTSAGATIAVAAHTDAKVKPDDMAASPVLVITHKAYANALREAEDADIPIRLDLYHRHHQSTRGWLIIDEAFNWVDVNRRSNLTPYRRPILTPLRGGF